MPDIDQQYSVRARFPRALIALWALIVASCLTLFVARFIVALVYESWNVWAVAWLFGICVVLLYGSFLIEGIILAASKIEEYDEDVTVRKMNQLYPTDNISTTLIYVKRKTQDILVGQPLVAIGITLLFNSIIETVGLHRNPDGTLVSTLAGEQLPRTVTYLMSSSLVSGILSAALIYWFAQLLPQSLGKQNAIEFMRSPLASQVARALVGLSGIGVGTPSVWLERLAPRRFRKRIELPVGDAKIFESLCIDYGYFVSKRKIIIIPGPDKVEVRDEITYRYLDGRRELRHSCRLAIDQFDGGIDFTLEFPDGTDRERERPGLFDLDLSRIVEGKDGQPPTLQSVYKERIHVIETSVGAEPPHLTSRAVYHRNALTFDSGRADVFAFDMGVPTREIEIRVKRSQGTLINTPPELTFGSEVARFFPNAQPLMRGTCVRVKDAEGWLLTQTFPPLSTEMKLQVDAREAHTASAPGTPEAASAPGTPEPG